MNKRALYIILGSVVLAAVIIGLIHFKIGLWGGSSGSYVAKVGSEQISEPEFMFFLNAAKTQMETDAAISSGDENAKKAFWNSENVKDTAKNKALEKAKEYKIQLIKAKDNKVTLTADETKSVDSMIDDKISSIGGKDEADKQFIKDYGVNTEQIKAIVKDSYIIGKYKQQEQAKIPSSEDDLKKFYDSNGKEFDTVTVRHILFATMNPEDYTPYPEDKKNEAKKKADDVLAKVKSGADFAELAKQYSEDPGSKETGGELSFTKGQMVPQFENWSFSDSRKAGDTDIVESEFGYHVMKFEKRVSTPYEQVKENLKAAYVESKYSDELEQLMKDSQYNVEKNDKVFNSIKVI